MDKIEEVVQRVYNPIRLYRAWEQVKKNNGAPGVDRVSIEEFEGIRDERMKLITDKLRKGQYRFKPSRRVEIDKPGSTKKRKLNIPTVMDRVVGCSIYYVLEELYDTQMTID